jgi:hypothetical protein
MLQFCGCSLLGKKVRVVAVRASSLGVVARSGTGLLACGGPLA